MAVQRPGSGPPLPGESDSPTLSQYLPATADSIGRLRHVVAHFARRHGASESSLEAVNLALSEALTNVVMHAYRDAPEPGPVLLVAAVRDGALLVTIADEGCGMTPRADSPGLGLGIGLIAGAADALEVTARAPGPGLVLQMRFGLTG